MEKQKSAGEKSAYTGRFGEQTPRKTAREAAPQHTVSAPRRPSGFSAAAPANRGKAGAKKTTEAATSEKKNARTKKESKRRQLPNLAILILCMVRNTQIPFCLKWDIDWHSLPVVREKCIG